MRRDDKLGLLSEEHDHALKSMITVTVEPNSIKYNLLIASTRIHDSYYIDSQKVILCFTACTFSEFWLVVGTVEQVHRHRNGGGGAGGVIAHPPKRY